MHVQEASSAVDALRILQEAVAGGDVPFDIALLDRSMPGTDGLVLARMISSDPRLSGLPQVLLTSSGDCGGIGEGRQAQFAACLSKPLSRDTLRQSIAGVIAAQRRDKPPALRHRAVNGEEKTAAHLAGRVLVAEDVPANQKVVESMLQRLGLEVDVVADGREVVARCAVQHFDLILMDCQMPEMDGFEATRHIRVAEKTVGRRVPIIAVTATATTTYRRKCLQAGMDDFIAKPFEMRTLAQVLARWLQGDAMAAPAPAATGMAIEGRDRVTDSAVELKTLDVLRDVLGDDFAQLIPAYLVSIGEMLAKLPGAGEQRNLAEVERYAHSIKSASQNLGAWPLADLSERLETHARENRLVDVPKQVEAMRQELEKVRVVLEGY